MALGLSFQTFDVTQVYSFFSLSGRTNYLFKKDKTTLRGAAAQGGRNSKIVFLEETQKLFFWKKVGHLSAPNEITPAREWTRVGRVRPSNEMGNGVGGGSPIHASPTRVPR